MAGGLAQPVDTPGNTPNSEMYAYGVQHTGQQAATGNPDGVTTTVDVGDMNGIERLLAGTNYSREDIHLALQSLSTAILLYWAYTEAT